MKLQVFLPLKLLKVIRISFSCLALLRTYLTYESIYRPTITTSAIANTIRTVTTATEISLSLERNTESRVDVKVFVYSPLIIMYVESGVVFKQSKTEIAPLTKNPDSYILVSVRNQVRRTTSSQLFAKKTNKKPSLNTNSVYF